MLQNRDGAVFVAKLVEEIEKDKFFGGENLSFFCVWTLIYWVERENFMQMK